MAYLVRAKGRPVRIRDIGRDGRPMIQVGHDPVLMMDLPAAALRLPGGDKDIEVVKAVDLAGYQLPEPVGTPKKIEAAPAPQPTAEASSGAAPLEEEPTPTASESTSDYEDRPRKRKGR